VEAPTRLAPQSSLSAATIRRASRTPQRGLDYAHCEHAAGITRRVICILEAAGHRFLRTQTMWAGHGSCLRLHPIEDTPRQYFCGLRKSSSALIECSLMTQRRPGRRNGSGLLEDRTRERSSRYVGRSIAIANETRPLLRRQYRLPPNERCARRYDCSRRWHQQCQRDASYFLGGRSEAYCSQVKSFLSQDLVRRRLEADGFALNGSF
jgi:hypothetical protein